jgi:hypothetical protein
MAALVALAACASPSSLRESKPDLDEVSDKPAEQLAGCIGDRFEDSRVDRGGMRLSTRPTSNGYSISGDRTDHLFLAPAVDTKLLVDITKLGNKTHVQLFTHVIAGEGTWIALVRSCL